MAEYLQKFLGGAKSAVSSASAEVDAGTFIVHGIAGIHVSMRDTRCITYSPKEHSLTAFLPNSRLRRLRHRCLTCRPFSRCLRCLFGRCHPGIQHRVLDLHRPAIHQMVPRVGARDHRRLLPGALHPARPPGRHPRAPMGHAR